MRLIKRIKVDLRGPDQDDIEVETELIANEQLVALQTDKNGVRNNIEIINMKEINKDSGSSVFTILYEDKSLDVVKPQ